MSEKKTPITGTIDLSVSFSQWSWYIVPPRGKYMVESLDFYTSRAAALQAARRAAKLLGIEIKSIEGDGDE